jgi:hypothetical protein
VALLNDSSEDASSHLTADGIGTNSATFTVPNYPPYAIQSVIATVDNGAGADTTATLTIADRAGEGVAKRVQGDVIPAGDTGTATFALRLAGNGGTGIRFNRNNTGSWLEVTTTANQPLTFDGIKFVVAQNSNFVLYDAQGNEIISAGAGNPGDFGMNLLGGGSGSLQVDVPFERHSIQGGIFRVTNLSLFDTDPDQFTVNAGDGITLTSQGTFAQINLEGPTFVRLRVGDALEVQDSGGNPIFRVNEDGSLQGKTGKALTFNL